MNFRNDISHCRFIGNRDLTEVIAQDTHELAELGGSFETIADRMNEFLNYVQPRKMQLKWGVIDACAQPVWDEFTRKYGNDLSNFSAKKLKTWKEAHREALRKATLVIAQQPITYYPEEDGSAKKISVINVGDYIIPQECPFEGCRSEWRNELYVINRDSDRILAVNTGTEHLVRAHHLLEKDNEYGISAKEFYEHFMGGKDDRK